MSSISRIAQPLEPPSMSVARWRVVAGIGVAVVTVSVIALFAVGVWNPWNNVVLLSYFADPFRGTIAVAVLGYTMLWLVWPVRSEALQRRRIAARVVAVIVGFVGLMGFGLYGTHFYDYGSSEVARSPGGHRAVAEVERWDYTHLRYHVFTGSGLATVDVAQIGPVCGPSDDITFRDEDTILVDNAYGEFVIPLDPATGRPLDHMDTCHSLASETMAE